MKKYFYSDGKAKHGPLSLDELKQESISNETLIWFEGLGDWTQAKELKEMEPILELQPPPIFKEQKNDSSESVEIKGKTTENTENQNRTIKKGMFSSPFSFDGRIRRLEYGISFIIVVIVNAFLDELVKSGETPIIGLAFIPILWFLWAQGAKRCHDMGKSGWYQIIPFYVFWLIFAKGESGNNKYGVNPKN